MIFLDEYLESPCANLSIPFWKAKTIKLPENMRIVHDKDFSEDYLTNYADEKYFRLYHRLDRIERIKLIDFDIITAQNNNLEDIVSVINKSYADIQVDYSQIEGYTKTPVYDPYLWILVREKSTAEYVGSGIADYDKEANELILEWIQVLPEYRGRKIGQAIVNELLFRMQNTAKFATVSGKVDNLSNPEALYRKCNFTGNDMWHILCAK